MTCGRRLARNVPFGDLMTFEEVSYEPFSLWVLGLCGCGCVLWAVNVSLWLCDVVVFVACGYLWCVCDSVFGFVVALLSRNSTFWNLL